MHQDNMLPVLTITALELFVQDLYGGYLLSEEESLDLIRAGIFLSAPCSPSSDAVSHAWIMENQPEPKIFSNN